MKKAHDQVIRNMHAEALKSSALPARFYVDGFKNLTHVVEVASNEQNLLMEDIKALVSGFRKAYLGRSIKQLKAPMEFVHFIKMSIIDLELAILVKSKTEVFNLLTETCSKLEKQWGYEAVWAKREVYLAENPLPSKWYEEDNLDEAYQAIWKKYFEFQKTLRFNSYWTMQRFFNELHKQVEKLVNL